MHQNLSKASIFSNRLDDCGEIYIYGFIGDNWSKDGVTAAAFSKELNELSKQFELIKVRINSGGGSVHDGIAIYQAIKRCTAATEAYIDGIAASMAMPVALACGKVYMSKQSKGMSHRVSGGAYGNADDLRNTATIMEEHEDDIADIIAKRTKLTKPAAKSKYITDSDRWINAKQALKEGLIDGVYDGADVQLSNMHSDDAIELMNQYNTVLIENITHTENSIYII